MEVVLETIHSPTSGPELLLDRGLGNELWLAAWYPVQALCEPGVDV